MKRLSAIRNKDEYISVVLETIVDLEWIIHADLKAFPSQGHKDWSGASLISYIKETPLKAARIQAAFSNLPNVYTIGDSIKSSLSM